jgi:hypothetical protein
MIIDEPSIKLILYTYEKGNGVELPDFMSTAKLPKFMTLKSSR